MSIRPLARAVVALALLAPLALSADARPVGAQAPAPARQFTLLIYEAPDDVARRTDPARGAAYWGAFAAFGDTLQAAGVLRGGTALRTGDAARTVTRRGGATRVRARTHARSAEELGGYFVIEVASLDEAVRWAARVPAAASGAVEVRPSYPAPTMQGPK